jgi:hypothetical protein
MVQRVAEKYLLHSLQSAGTEPINNFVGYLTLQLPCHKLLLTQM